MKKILIILFILPLIFSSCEEEDNTPSVSTPSPSTPPPSTTGYLMDSYNIYKTTDSGNNWYKTTDLVDYFGGGNFGFGSNSMDFVN